MSKERERATAGHCHEPRGGLLRGAAVSVVSAVLAASGLAGAGVAEASEPVVIGTCTEDVSSDSFGQRIVAAPTALDAKVKQAALLVFPLQFERAEKIRKQFLESDPVELGKVTEQDRRFSGSDLAEALAPSIAAVPSVEDKGEAVNFHVGNLATVGCLDGVSVPGQEDQQEQSSSRKPTSTGGPPPSSEPAPAGTSESPAKEPTGEPTGEQRPTSEPAASSNSELAGAGDSKTERTVPNHPPGPAERVAPSDYAYVPGSLPPWSDTRFGEAPGGSAETGDLRASEQPNQQDHVREAGSAEALPSETGKRVALPVLLAAISLAGVTSALIRTWVLRRT